MLIHLYGFLDADREGVVANIRAILTRERANATIVWVKSDCEKDGEPSRVVVVSHGSVEDSGVLEALRGHFKGVDVLYQ